MKTLSKVLCLLMVAVMCMSFFGASASAFSINIGGSGSSSTGSINIPVAVSDDDETETTPAPKATPALDAGFGAGEPEDVDDEGFSAEMDPDADSSDAVDAIVKAIEDGQTNIKFNGYFSFEETTLEITKNVTFSLPTDSVIEYANNIVVKKGATLSITGSGDIDVLPTVEEGGKLLIYGCVFGDEDPSKYVADGYAVEVVDGVYYKVVKKAAAADEPKAEDEPEDKDVTVYVNPKNEIKTIELSTYNYVKGSTEEFMASFDTKVDGDFTFFFIAKSSNSTITDDDLLAYFEIAYDGTAATLYGINKYLDGLSEGSYWFGGGCYKGTAADPESVRYSKQTLQIKNKDVPSTGDGTGGILVSVYDKQYTANGGWESGDGHLYFVYTPGDYTVFKITIDDLDHKVILTLDNEQWKDNGNGYFYVGESQFLNQLSKGEHTITLYAKDANGNVFNGSCNFLVLQDPAPTLEFSGTYKHVINSGKSLKLKCSEPIKAVYAGKNGTRLDNFDYTMYKLSSDGKTLTLTPEFLNARTAGYSYALWVEDASGNESNVVYFQILTTAQANASVDTGDASDIALWAAFLILSGAAVAVALPRVKKNGGKE